MPHHGLQHGVGVAHHAAGQCPVKVSMMSVTRVSAGPHLGHHGAAHGPAYGAGYGAPQPFVGTGFRWADVDGGGAASVLC